MIFTAPSSAGVMTNKSNSNTKSKDNKTPTPPALCHFSTKAVIISLGDYITYAYSTAPQRDICCIATYIFSNTRLNKVFCVYVCRYNSSQTFTCCFMHIHVHNC
ncbi:unnamed protein product [Ceratitis capitata]|uniref:(Mediterranean fruit fly) hypothetical protein n=1 Tax=Ceratitis capitata TaxID=7213 RepID=A0A811U462_CERCA|nr:unnamed protein product [Ceratitis capitata]